jgi:hypothetical protein
MINYADDEMLVPIMETVVFIGRNLEPNDVRQVYFQDVESHRERRLIGGTQTMAQQSSKMPQKTRSLTYLTTSMRWKNS